MRWVVLMVALLHAALGQAGALRAEETCPGAAQGFRRFEPDRDFAVHRWVPAELKVGQFFAVEVVVCGAARAARIERVIVYAVMPAHGHGMNYGPTTERISPGHYRFTGLMLHMPGIWRFTFMFEFRNNSSITYSYDVDLKR